MSAIALESVHRALIVAPHPDDEAIAAFGLMRLLRRRGVVVQVVVVTDGSAARPNATEAQRRRLTRTRYAETRRVLARAGLRSPDVQFLGFRDGQLGFADRRTQNRLMRRLARRARPDLIVTPSINDNHRDHRATARAVAQAWPACIPRLSYLVWPRQGPYRPRPRGAARRCKLSSGDALGKRQALRLYRSQIDPDPDDGTAFRITRAMFRRFAHPVEIFGARS